MPRNKPQAPTTSRSGNIQFVDPMLAEPQKAELKNWASGLDPEQLLQFVAEVVQDGYAISVKRNDTGAQCSFTPMGDDHKDHGKILIARASGPIAALKVAIFKHFYVLKQEWPSSPHGPYDL